MSPSYRKDRSVKLSKKLLSATGLILASTMLAGCAGFGIGSNIYKPGMTAADIGERARKLVAAFKAAAGVA